MLSSFFTYITLLCATLTSALPVKRRPQPSPYKRLVIFGNSYSDNGGGAWVISNHTWPADPAYWNHSFSNGPVWGDYLSRRLSIPLLDYAHGGATIDNSFVTGYTGPHGDIVEISATQQIEDFLTNDSVKEGDIFVHWIGLNDIFFDTSITGSESTSLITRNIDTLFRAGAKTVMLGNYPPANKFPATVGVAAYAQVGPVYAKSLTYGLQDVVSAFSGFIQIGLADIEALFVDMFAHPKKFGIDPKYVHPPTACLKGVYSSEGVPRSLCDDPKKHLFFDSYHAVTQVHETIAGVFYKTLMNLE